MKKFFISITLICTASVALSNGYTSPAPTGQQFQGQAQGQGQGQIANAVSGSDADSYAEGGDSKSGSYAAGSSMTNRNASLFLNFPLPTWTVVPGSKWSCMATQSRSKARGWNFTSDSESVQATDAPCLLWKMYESAMANCQYQTAHHINNRNLAIITPGMPEMEAPPKLRNLSYEECEAIRRPTLMYTPTITVPPAERAPRVDRQ